MWVVKLGGSLSTDASLPHWLAQLTQQGGGRVVVVCGGGTFAQEVRQVQQHWGFDDLAAHNMALLGMAQTALMLQALNPNLTLALDDAAIAQALAAGGVPLWSPMAALSDHPDANTNWDVTSDSLALLLADRLGARGLILVKSCEAPHGSTPAQWTQHGLVDTRFASLAASIAQDKPLDIVMLAKHEWHRLGDFLLAE